ncbi:hypothetical protein TH9_21845 [Thalassospira xiamenensis]|nr:hypothetical protein TH9_21845 [Thalassospira xiamenensis]
MRRMPSGPGSAAFRMVIRRYRHTFGPAIIRIDKRCEFKWLTRCHFLAILAIQISVVLVKILPYSFQRFVNHIPASWP